MHDQLGLQSIPDDIIGPDTHADRLISERKSTAGDTE